MKTDLQGTRWWCIGKTCEAVPHGKVPRSRKVSECQACMCMCLPMIHGWWKAGGKSLYQDPIAGASLVLLLMKENGIDR